MGDKPVGSVCKYCDKRFTQYTNLRRHVRKFHAEPVKTVDCKEEGCSTAFKTRQELASHLTSFHSLSFLEETAEFSSMDEFKQWKDDLECREHVSFIQHCGSRKGTDCTVVNYFCNRSGSFTSGSTGKRRVKESCKIGQSCTAYMIVRVNNVSGSVSVKFCRSHYGHQIQLRHLHLTEAEASETPADMVMQEEMDEHVDVATVLSCIGQQGPSRDADAAKADLLQRLAALHSQVSACPAELSFISEVRKHVSAIENLAKLQTVPSELTSASSIPPNKNLEQQRPLVCHKRKRTAQKTVPKPTLKEKTTIA